MINEFLVRFLENLQKRPGQLGLIMDTFLRPWNDSQNDAPIF